MKYTQIPIKEQPTTNLYEMSIRFKASVKPTNPQNSITTLYAKSTITLHLKQVTSFIPDDKTLQTYINTIKTAYTKNAPQITIENIRFDGYDYIHIVKPNEQE